MCKHAAPEIPDEAVGSTHYAVNQHEENSGDVKGYDHANEHLVAIEPRRRVMC
jgi:hypothetical protein